MSSILVRYTNYCSNSCDNSYLFSLREKHFSTKRSSPGSISLVAITPLPFPEIKAISIGPTYY